jgi:hypothetical protein
MSGSGQSTDVNGPADKGSWWDEERPGLDQHDDPNDPDAVSPDVIMPDLDKPTSEPGFGPL